MREKAKFIVLDVEGFNSMIPYNIGYIIADKHGNIYKKRSFVFIGQLLDSLDKSEEINQAIEMTNKNAREILNDFLLPKRKRKYRETTFNAFIEFFLKDIQDYKIKKIYAYNVAFDKKCLENLFKNKFDALKNQVEFIDIIPIILHTKLLTEKYCRFCIKNNFLTEKGNIQTKAEIVYKYLKNDLEFEEEHTGLADVLIEYDILLIAFKTKKKINSQCCQAWRLLKNFCKEKNIIIEPLLENANY